MKFVIGFFMAWGNFITLPCPYKRWDNNLKNMMLAFLPSIGLVVGLLWYGLYYLLAETYWLISPPMITSLAMIFYIFAICGFMHMDGFMDCNDAIMSRRPLEDRQRILKDSLVGAFAVVTAVFLILAWFAAMVTAVEADSIDWRIVLIPVFSRGISGLQVLTCKPIGHSQYVKDYEDKGRMKYRIAVIVQMLLVLAVILQLDWYIRGVLWVAAVVSISGLLACFYGRKQLGGMSGDIAGYAICISELAGILTVAVI